MQTTELNIFQTKYRELYDQRLFRILGGSKARFIDEYPPYSKDTREALRSVIRDCNTALQQRDDGGNISISEMLLFLANPALGILLDGLFPRRRFSDAEQAAAPELKVQAQRALREARQNAWEHWLSQPWSADSRSR